RVVVRDALERLAAVEVLLPVAAANLALPRVELLRRHAEARSANCAGGDQHRASARAVRRGGPSPPRSRPRRGSSTARTRPPPIAPDPRGSLKAPRGRRCGCAWREAERACAAG